MSTTHFDTLDYAKKAKEVGFSEAQAEFQAKAIAQVIDETVATKKDIEELKIELRNEIKVLEYKLTIKLGAMLVVAVSILATIIKFH